MNRSFQRVSGARVGRSVFDLSYEHLTTGDMGLLYPIMCREMVPGDVFDYGVNLVIRFNPLTAPILHPVNAFVHCFFVPYRLLDDDWEDFITGGADGTEAPSLPTGTSAASAGSVYDYLGYPLGSAFTYLPPILYPAYAYNLIYNEWYRDQTAITEVALNSTTIKRRAWEKDYFTSALPWQQRGTAPALPISGTIDIDGKDEDIIFTDEGGVQTSRVSADTFVVKVPDNAVSGDIRWSNPALEVDVSGATTFDVADLRLAFQTQKFLERNARAGARYTEFLGAHFGVKPRDDRLDRPEYCGGLRAPVIVSEVLQTSATGIGSETTPQGNLAGHGIAVASQRVARIRAPEFGVCMAILSVMPKRVYSQGLDRQWIKSTRYDFYFPEFARLSEQPIYNGELYLQGASADANVFGYQERFSEMRSSKSILTGEMRPDGDFEQWHLGEKFTSLPTLGQTFLECTPRDTQAFAAPSEHQMLIRVGNNLRAVRPLPVSSDPGMIDH